MFGISRAGICLEQSRALGRDEAEEMWDILNASTPRTGITET